MAKQDVYMWLGALLILGGLFMFFLGALGATVASEETETDATTTMIIMGSCTTMLLVPGIILFAMGRKIKREEDETSKIASYLQSFRRIKTSDVARKLGKTEYEAEQLIIKSIQKGLIVGYFDRATGEFFTYQSMFQEVGRPDKCPNCGASMYARVLTGESAVCNFCGTHFTPKPPPGAPRPYYPQQQYPQQQPAPQQYSRPYPPYPQVAPTRTAAPPPQPRTAAPQTNVRCPSCKKVFEVSVQTRPFRISCPFCRIEGIMR